MCCFKVVKTMRTNVNLLSGFILLLFIAESTSALIPAPPVPTVDDLLGPGQCPSGSVCIETTYCTIEYATTKTGLPFHCGPRYQIDSMVCCIINVEAETTDPTASFQENHGTPHTGEDIMNEMMNTNEINSAERTNRTSEDDEVDILAVPFATNQFDEHELPISDFDGHFDTWGDDLESLIEDAIEHENLKQNIRETEPALKDFLEEQREYIFPTNNMKDPLPVYVASRGQTGPPSWEHPNSRAYEPKPFPNPGSDRPNMNNCPCERGEKGETGPKGDPGEPGQIIYIPVFVNSPGYPTIMPSGMNNGAVSGAPLSFNPSNPPNQPNVQTYYGQSNAPVPQHPNPTVVPYNVPINLAPTVPTQQQPQLAPQYHIQNQQQQPSSAPPADISLEARPTRHATNDPRYANRRY